MYSLYSHAIVAYLSHLRYLNYVTISNTETCSIKPHLIYPPNSNTSSNSPYSDGHKNLNEQDLIHVLPDPLYSSALSRCNNGGLFRHRRNGIILIIEDFIRFVQDEHVISYIEDQYQGFINPCSVLRTGNRDYREDCELRPKDDMCVGVSINV